MKLGNVVRAFAFASVFFGTLGTETSYANNQCIADARAAYQRAVSECNGQAPGEDNGGGGSGGGWGGGPERCINGRRCSDYNAHSKTCHLWDEYTVCGRNCTTRKVCSDYNAHSKTCHLWTLEASCR